jgi:phosphate transport system substrate-binding protein
MLRFRFGSALIAGLCLVQSLLPAARAQDEPAAPDTGHYDVRIVGPFSTNQICEGIARSLKDQAGLNIGTKMKLTNAEALDTLAQGSADIALLTGTLSGLQRASYPDLDFVEIPIGMEVVALGISNDVWQAGLHALPPDQIRAIYEQKIRNWKEVGGPDEAITFYNFEQGAGIWEIFAQWFYQDNRKAPLPKVQSVQNSADARDDLEFTPGAIVPIGAAYVDGTRCHSLGILLPAGASFPTVADVAASRYPLVRPITAVVIGRPTLDIRKVTEFLTGAAGQAMVRQSGALGLDAVPKPPPSSYGW